MPGEEQQHFAKMKQALAGHLLVTEAADVFDVKQARHRWRCVPWRAAK